MKSVKVMQELNDLSQALIEFQLNYFSAVIQGLNLKLMTFPG
jgi:hypothetical protein